jgi:signal transduction histidine kinase
MAQPPSTNAHPSLSAAHRPAWLAAVLDLIEDGLLILDIEGRVLFANKAISALSDLSIKQILTTRIDEWPDQGLKMLGYQQSEIESILHGLKDQQPPAPSKTIFEVRTPQRTRSFNRTTTPVREGDQAIIIGLIILLSDITESHEIEQARDVITETIVHDLRSPMSTIVGAMELLTDTLCDTHDPIIKQTLLVAQRSVNRAISLTDTLLDIARLQSGRMEIQYESIALPTLLSELMVEYTALANDDGVILSSNLPAHLPAIHADRDKLIRIITNLVDNAIKFTPGGGHVTITAEQNTPQQVTIKIIDTGPGIPQDYREKIFERFIQVPGQYGRRHGTGLGLAFCRLTVEAHGGEIWVAPNPEGGSIFSFTMPIVQSPR